METNKINRWLTELKQNMFVKAYDINLEVIDELHLEGFVGLMLSGVFGYSLKSVCCPKYFNYIEDRKNTTWQSQHPKEECKVCSKIDLCPYYFLYEPKIWSKEKSLKVHRVGKEEGFRLLPPPFVIEPPIVNYESLDLVMDSEQSKPLKLIWKPGDHFAFRLVLFGYSNYYLPIFISAIDTLCKIGLGNRHSRMRLKTIKIYYPDNEVIADSSKKSCYFSPHEIFNSPSFITNDLSGLPDFSESNLKQINLRFVTPLRCDSSKEGNENDMQKILLDQDSSQLENNFFRIFCLKIKSRLKEMTEAYGNCFSFDIHPFLFREAYEIKTKTWLQAKDFWEESKSQGTKFHFLGFVGVISFSGKSLEYFLPLLTAGSIFHVGSLTSEGFGEYAIEIPD